MHLFLGHMDFQFVTFCWLVLLLGVHGFGNGHAFILGTWIFSLLFVG